MTSAKETKPMLEINEFKCISCGNTSKAGRACAKCSGTMERASVDTVVQNAYKCQSCNNTSEAGGRCTSCNGTMRRQ